MEMTLILCIFLSLLIITITFILFVYLFKKKDEFPYANISPLWTLTLLCCVFIHQLLTISILIVFRLYGKIHLYYYLNLLNTLFIHYIMIWPIIGRVYYIMRCVEFNFSFLTKKVYPNYLEYDNRLDFHHKIYSEHRNVYITRLILFPMTGLFLVLLTLSLIPCTRCYLYAFNMYFKILLAECQDYMDKITALILTLLRDVIDCVEIFVFMTLLYLTFKYPIRKDHFKIKLELFTLFAIWIIFHGFYHGLLLFQKISYNLYLTYFINVIEGSSYLSLTFYLIFFRKTITSKCFDTMLHDYDVFLQNPICFNFFKEFIKNVAEYEYNFLFFYIDYHFFKRQYTTNSKEDNIEYAHIIFSNYFLPTDKISRNSNTSSNEKNSNNSLDNKSIPFTSKTQNKSCFFIEFPVETQERVEELANKNFQCYDIKLEDVFDEAFLYVNNKLYNRYLTLFRNEEEYKKLQKLICYFDFDFVNHENN